LERADTQVRPYGGMQSPIGCVGADLCVCPDGVPMKYNRDIHHRRSIRLRGYDYSQAGAYFITICAQDRECLFGDISTEPGMRLNDSGRMVGRWYLELENKFHDIQCDDYICMPNHTHFIIVNAGADLRVCLDGGNDSNNGRTHRSAPTGYDKRFGGFKGSPLSAVVQWFKTMTTNEYIRGVRQRDWKPFPGRLWQRNYWEHIIRNQEELNQIREYIRNNPEQWECDQLYVGGTLSSNEIKEPAYLFPAKRWMV